MSRSTDGPVCGIDVACRAGNYGESDVAYEKRDKLMVISRHVWASCKWCPSPFRVNDTDDCL